MKLLGYWYALPVLTFMIYKFSLNMIQICKTSGKQNTNGRSRFMSYIIFIFIIIVFHICVDYCKGARPTCCHEASDLAMNSALIATAPNNIGYRMRIML